MIPTLKKKNKNKQIQKITNKTNVKVQMAKTLDLFNPSSGVSEQPKNSELYKVSYKDSKTGVYKAVIRFIPNPKDPSRCTMSKFVAWVKNPLTQKGMYIDDPRSVNQESSISNMYWALKNSGIASYASFADEYLGGKKQYASLVQIMSDDQHPELVGQIKVFVYGSKLYEKLRNEEYPPVGEGIKPFHPYLGRKFSLVCTNQSNYNNFDQSGFFDERNGNQILPSGMWYIDPANPNQFSVCDENTDGQVLIDYLNANAPDLSKYDFQPWNEAQTKHVEEVLAVAQNFLTNGTFGTPTQPQTYAMPGVPQVPPQAAFPGGQQPRPSYNPNPSFPGATVPQQPQYQAQQAPQVPQTPNVAPPVAAPIAGAPVPPPQPQQQVSGVTPPNVVPQGAVPGGTQPQGGMNMDDILSRL